MLTLIFHRQRGLSGKPHAVDGVKRVRARDRTNRAIPAPEANAENQVNLDVSRTSFLSDPDIGNTLNMISLHSIDGN